ncbi:hypothetical protein BDM02DRAFT_1110418 [Thelephora ganbajun]|uniref:Uncharacterized protein n=1 Tax=Thelephora ganbajun TaxID=370292 RepID=A0ACB6ZW71_THEGA|nr:hypothetical protein BDM02DRAFT_1110418 [Thelephora ganbajun]
MSLSPVIHLQTNNRRVNPSQDGGFTLNVITTRQRVTMIFPQRSREAFPRVSLERKSDPKSFDSTWVPSWIRRLLSSTLTDLSARSITRSRSGSPGETTWSLDIRPTESSSTGGETSQIFTPLPLCHRFHLSGISHRQDVTEYTTPLQGLLFRHDPVDLDFYPR